MSNLRKNLKEVIRQKIEKIIEQKISYRNGIF